MYNTKFDYNFDFFPSFSFFSFFSFMSIRRLNNRRESRREEAQ